MPFKPLMYLLILNTTCCLAQVEPYDIVMESEWQDQQTQTPTTHKINLNDFEALKTLCPNLLSLEQIQAIYWHCQTYGPLLLLQELQSIPCCQTIDFKHLNQFIESEPLLFRASKPNYVSVCSAFPLQSTSGFTKMDSTRFLGNNQKHQLALRYHYKAISCYLQSEKDPGEPYQYKTNFGSVTFKKKYYRICMGDQHIVFGQGLLFGSKQAFYNSLNFQIIQHNNEIKPKTDFAENGSIRGMGIDLFQNKPYKLQAFYGYYLLDNNSTTLGNGLYRNATEHAVKWKAAKPIGGISFQTHFRKCQLAINWMESLSLSAKTSIKLWYCFGEFKLSQLTKAYYLGGLRSFGKKFSLAWSILNNHNDDKQKTMYSNYRVFDQASLEYNVITQTTLSKQAQVNAQFCIGKIEEPTRIPQFSSFYQFQFNYQFNKKEKLSLVFNGKQDQLYTINTLGQKTNLKLSFSHDNQTIKLLGQCLIKTANASKTKAYILSESMRIKLRKNFELSLLGAIFNNFEQAYGLSLYEHNLPGQQTLFTYYHKGFHWHTMLHIKCLKDLNIWIRFAATSYAQAHEFGSGLDLYKGNYKSTLNTGIKWAL